MYGYFTARGDGGNQVFCPWVLALTKEDLEVGKNLLLRGTFTVRSET